MLITERIDEIAPKTLHFGLIVIAALVTIQINIIQNGWISDDSVLYFEFAKRVASGDIEHALQLYQWPAYPFIIAYVHKLTGLTIHHAAQVLNTVFMCITMASFIQLIRMLGGTQLTMLAGGLLLLSNQYIVGDVLPMLIRDQGFWAFFLTSLVSFLEFIRKPNHKTAIAWQLSAFTAALFRVEGIIYLLVLPFYTLVDTSISKKLSERIKVFVLASLPTIILVLIGSCLLHLSSSFQLDALGRLRELISPNLISEHIALFLIRSEAMSDMVLGRFLDEYAHMSLVLTLLVIVIVKIANATGIITLLLGTYSLNWRHKFKDTQAVNLLLFTAILSFINAYLIITKVFVLSGRYVIPLALIIMVFASFGLSRLFNCEVRQFRQSRLVRIVLWSIIAFCVLSLLNNILPKKEGYNYEQDAVSWAINQTSSNSEIFYNTPRMRHYAKVPFVSRQYDTWQYALDEIKSERFKEDYTALVISIDGDLEQKIRLLVKALPDFQLVNEFSNPTNKKKVVVFLNKSKEH